MDENINGCRRIIVIDDNPNIYKDFKTILIEDSDSSELDILAAEYFGENNGKTTQQNNYQLDYAAQGKEGVEKIRQALINNCPFALAFVDMRMPPGWDGLETIEHLWKVDPDIQVVICSAYSDYSREEIIERVGNTDKLLILKKPFDTAEVAQLASALTEKWRLTRQAALKMSEIEERVKKRTSELAKTNEQLQQEIVERKRTEETLRISNQKILKQQKSVIEEERLKILLQLAGVTAHELNQPLMTLLENIKLIVTNKNNPEKTDIHINSIEETGRQLSAIVEKIQTIHHDEPKLNQLDSSAKDIHRNITILSIEDSDVDYATHKAMLNKFEHIHLTRAKSIQEAVQQIEKDRFDLIFLDYRLPDGTGLDFLKIMDKKGDETPVIAITGQGDEMVASQFIQSGAYDYLPKGRTSMKAFSRIITNTLEKARLKKEILEARNKMARMSAVDELTGLFNRRYFNEAIEREVSRAKRHKINLVLCIMDLDHFKNINDTYSHLAGDMVLSVVGEMLIQCFRKDDLICRYGGEEFAFILPHTPLDNALLACERFRETLSKHLFEFNGSQFNLTTSIGIAPFNDSMAHPTKELVELADNALYKAKKEGRNKVTFFLKRPKNE